MILELPVAGMDCAECTLHVQQAIVGLPGVVSVNVLLAAERATVRLDPQQVDLAAIRRAVESAGYSVPQAAARPEAPHGAAQGQPTGFELSIGLLLALLFGVILFIVVVGEWLGLFERLNTVVPWPVWLVLVIAGGYPVFRNVLRATLRRQVISHTLMTVGVLAALAVGEWVTAAVVVLFMRIGDYVEHFTAMRARRAVKALIALAPRTARIERDGAEVDMPLADVRVGDVAVVRPGEQIPVDGEVIGGYATVDQAAITGESMPVEAGPGARVYAATFARLGSLRVRCTRVGADTTFGKVVRLVEEAEANRAGVQRLADRFSTYFLPFVAGIAGLTLLVRRDPLAAAAVLVVACSCSVALATPIAMLASIGAGARRGLLIKGGRYLESLARADVMLIDKTGTLTLGRPQITDIIAAASLQLQASDLEAGDWQLETEVLRLAAAAERYSEHPLAQAVRTAATARGLQLGDPREFVALPGLGVQATVYGRRVVVGNRRLATDSAGSEGLAAAAAALEAQGKTLLWVTSDGRLVGLIAAADTLRPEAPGALAAVAALGMARVELLTGDNERAAADLAGRLGIPFRANLLPEDKIRIVREYQAQGHRVVMVGDGINDAPALAQADVGVALAVAGADIAIEASHVALLREDWNLLPELLRIARRTMQIVKMNLAFTALYNVIGLSLAALGLLPPMLAAAAQSLPDLGILGNSARLLRQPEVGGSHGVTRD